MTPESDHSFPSSHAGQGGQTPLSPIDFAQQLKDKLAIDQVVLEYVPSLARHGSSFKGLCPFHNEKTPSFHVHPERGFYHCFGCGKHGDAIKFVQEIEKVDFMTALEILARRAGMKLPDFRGSGARAQRSDEEERRLQTLRDLCAWASKFFIEQLDIHPRGRVAREYLLNRGIDEEQIRIYNLGYAPDGYETLLNAAAHKGWNAETVAEAGLASRRERGGFIDRFHDRVIFPIEDRMGQVVAFAGRLLEKKEDAPKYINSAETPIFKKGHTLYGYSRAREAIQKNGEAVLLEGYMDWLALHRRGLANVLAGMGTALTEDQARLVKRIAPRVTLLYDGDEAGQKAMFRSTEILLHLGMAVHAAVLPAEHDPDTFIEAQGSQAMRDILSQAPAALDYFIDQFARAGDLTRPEGKAEAVGKLAPLLLAIEDPVLREGYLGRAASRLGLKPDTLEATLRRRRRPSPATGSGVEASGGAGGEFGGAALSPIPSTRSEQYLLYVVLQSQNRWELLPAIEPEWFTDEALSSMLSKLQEAAKDIREGADPPSDLFDLCGEPSESEALSLLLLLPAQRFGGELPDFKPDLQSGLELQCLKLRKRLRERQKRELGQDLELILAEKPLGEGHLAKIDEINQEHLRQHADFLARHAPTEG